MHGEFVYLVHAGYLIRVKFAGKSFDDCNIWWVDEQGVRQNIERLREKDAEVIYKRIYNVYLAEENRRHFALNQGKKRAGRPKSYY